MKTEILKNLYFLFLILGVSCASTTDTSNAAFPTDWAGNWAGVLHISNGSGLVQKIDMELSIQPIADSTFSYTIIYGEDKPENHRPYLLKSVDAPNGHYIVDEQNSILLDEYFLGGKLYSRFEVSGTLLLATVEQRNKQLIYEIIAGPLQPVRSTGDTIHEDEEIPPVNSYQIRVQQRAILERIK